MAQIDNAALAQQFKALAHPRRVRIFRLLAELPEIGRSFQSLQHETGLCNSSLAHHLREMERCGVIRRRRRGTFMTFRLETSALAQAIGEALRLSQALHRAPRRAA